MLELCKRERAHHWLIVPCLECDCVKQHKGGGEGASQGPSNQTVSERRAALAPWRKATDTNTSRGHHIFPSVTHIRERKQQSCLSHNPTTFIRSLSQFPIKKENL